MRIQALSSFLVIALIVLASSVSAQEYMEEETDFIATAAKDPQFTIFIEAIKSAGITRTLRDIGPFTVFAPTNEAFNSLPEEKLNRLLNKDNREYLVQVITYHLIKGKHKASELGDKADLRSVEGAPLKLSSSDGVLRVNGANITQADISASNAVIHAIDTLLIPKDVKGKL
ncbi:fasciclin domain-containing protein [Alteromonas sp. ASW11-130]|uniref:fasciclin domain-containing protein n=1 Tax=Alteromonas sp. ASW11-130 TaxID=3015775 RepID=UPI0022421952|nr:fasciclin domain-containing protein [Alteromonas sp. ASW11-130]MCW8092621.1 fasciclin domain-containing protein [Alteromonas sp. ASW11-130]